MVMRVFKTKAFNKFALKNQISDDDLKDAILRAEKGLIDANLGANIFKQRVARKGQGRSGGFRTFIFYRINENSYFVAGISKNDRENISSQELLALRELVQEYAKLDMQKIEEMIKKGYFIEILMEKTDE